MVMVDAQRLQSRKPFAYLAQNWDRDEEVNEQGEHYSVNVDCNY